ncbi:XRE family transcriptional regulator [Variovorax ureilyticus]|uniref:XRE family transcriptional regulator n=1 Tax=Variovorax ureilyticus TaxID=1836198 RepID=UPI003D674B0C
MKSIGERIKWAREQRDMTQEQVALLAKVATSTIGNAESGLRKKPRELNAIAASLGASATWLETGRGEWQQPGGSPGATGLPLPDSQQPEHAGTMNKLRRVPIVGTAKMGDDGFYEELSAMPGAGDGHIDIATGDPNAYGLRVRGMSMAPAIRDGWYVVVEPNGQLVQGEYVLIKLLDGKKMVKELLFQRNGAYEIMSVNGEERRTIYNDEIEGIQAVGAVVPPSKWKPD